MTLRSASIRDIAARAGTSVSTVSAVLNGSWQKRRIKPDTAEKIAALADQMGFLPNRQAQALRGDRSGMIGMILPMHDNRFFSAISQQFEQESRARGLFPVIVSALRDPELELDAARHLLGYRIDTLFVVGATAPDAVADLALANGVRVFNLDLPGTRAPSIVSDSFGGCRALTDAVLAACPVPVDRALFIGGRPADHATGERLRGFLASIGDNRPGLIPEIVTEGYGADKAEARMRAILAEGGPPPVIVVNSTIAFEGVVRVLRDLPPAALARLAIGVFDYDPFAALLNMPILMVRQRGDRLVQRAFEELARDEALPAAPILIACEMVETPLWRAMTARSG